VGVEISHQKIIVDHGNGYSTYYCKKESAALALTGEERRQPPVNELFDTIRDGASGYPWRRWVEPLSLNWRPTPAHPTRDGRKAIEEGLLDQ